MEEMPQPPTCPITLCVPKKPVLFGDGYTYERKAIEDVIKTADKESPPRSPITRQICRNRKLAVDKFTKNEVKFTEEVDKMPVEKRTPAFTDRMHLPLPHTICRYSDSLMRIPMSNMQGVTIDYASAAELQVKHGIKLKSAANPIKKLPRINRALQNYVDAYREQHNLESPRAIMQEALQYSIQALMHMHSPPMPDPPAQYLVQDSIGWFGTLCFTPFPRMEDAGGVAKRSSRGVLLQRVKPYSYTAVTQPHSARTGARATTSSSLCAYARDVMIIQAVENGRCDANAIFREGQVLDHLRHPCILETFGVVMINGVESLVVEHCADNLENVIKQSWHSQRHVLTQEHHIVILTQIACGMMCLRVNGMVHCNLSLPNVLLLNGWTEDPYALNVKISGFRLAKFRRRKLGDAGLRIALTRYSAPEAIMTGVFKPPCDVWSFGVLAAMLLQHEVTPYPRQNTSSEIAAAICSGIPFVRPRSKFASTHCSARDHVRNAERKQGEEFHHSKGTTVEEQCALEATLWELVEKCCTPQPHKRPTFKRIVATFKQHQNLLGFRWLTMLDKLPPDHVHAFKRNKWGMRAYAAIRSERIAVAVPFPQSMCMSAADSERVSKSRGEESSCSWNVSQGTRKTNGSVSGRRCRKVGPASA
eukprot:m.194618 g.194618  ORF g.194618 m.194618 type:complete len:647 (-) comp18654_c0_seq1:319-2259(-)